jgi:hypothetical protein
MSDEEKDNIVIRKLVPNAIVVPVDGRDVIVPTDRGENARMNMMVASVMRSLLMENIKNYKDKEVTLTPKELADLAKALKDINSASLEIYAAAESKANPLEGIKVADASHASKPLSFDKIKKPPTIEVKADNESG